MYLRPKGSQGPPSTRDFQTVPSWDLLEGFQSDKNGDRVDSDLTHLSPGKPTST